jgi:hypothetical protein
VTASYTSQRLRAVEAANCASEGQTVRAGRHSAYNWMTLAQERSAGSGLASTTNPYRPHGRRRAVPPPTELPEELPETAVDALLAWWDLLRECSMPPFTKPALNDHADEDAGTCEGLNRGRHRLLVMTVRLWSVLLVCSWGCTAG